MPKPFPAEFRRDVIAMVSKGEAAVAQIARDFGISESWLQRRLEIANREDGLVRSHLVTARWWRQGRAGRAGRVAPARQAARDGEREPAAGDGLLRP